MIAIHPRFRSEAEALEATTAARTAAIVQDVETCLPVRGRTNPPTHWVEVGASLRIARLAHELAVSEAARGYAGPYRAAPDPSTCACAVCVWRRANRVGGET